MSCCSHSSLWSVYLKLPHYFDEDYRMQTISAFDSTMFYALVEVLLYKIDIFFVCLLYSEISLIVALSFSILQVSIDGSITVPLTQFNGASLYIGLDYDYRYI